jgi:hypothetical protein
MTGIANDNEAEMHYFFARKRCFAVGTAAAAEGGGGDDVQDDVRCTHCSTG